MKGKAGTIAIVVALVLLAGAVMGAARTAVSAQGDSTNVAETSATTLSTPQLIEAAVAKGEIDRDTANLYLAYALGDYEQLPARYRSSVPWHGTLPMLQLQEAVKTMKVGPTRTTIERVLTGTCGSSSTSLPSTTNSSHFHIEYGTIGGGLALNNYVNSLETTWDTEINSFGWAAPPILGSNPPPGNRYHVRIDNLGSGLYGYVTNSGVHAGSVGDNPDTGWNDGDAYATCMVLNNDYSAFPGSSQQALDATTAHEFNHSIQFGYGSLHGANAPDDAFVEGGATWMEDEVFDTANDNYNYLWPNFSMCMGEYTDSPYPYWITFRGLTEQYGTGGVGEDIMQDFWEETSKNSGDNLGAMETALSNAGTTLASAYHDYAIAAKFNKPCGGGYSYPYCFEEGADYVSFQGSTPLNDSIGSVGGSYNGSVQDNFALNWVGLPTGSSAYTVTLQNTSGGGQLRASVVCDTGSSLNVTPLPSVVSGGGSATLPNFNPSGCNSVVAVITNQAKTADNPSSCTARSYTLITGSGGTTPPPTGSSVFLPLVQKPDPAASSGFVNGDFESGPTGWTEFSANGYSLITDESATPVDAHGGSWLVWLGGAYDEVSYIEQQVTVPVSRPYLSYWHWIASQDVCGYDFAGVGINLSIDVDRYDLCDANDTGGWVQRVVNLSIFAGQTVTVQIWAATDDSLNSNLFVDDVSFQASAVARSEAPPTFTPDATKQKSDFLAPPTGEATETERLLHP